MATAPADRIDVDPAGELQIRPLQPTIGAEIGGIDLSRPLTPLQRDAIKAAVLKHKVVFFRDQNLDNDSHAAFARAFGPLYTHPSTTRDPKIASIHKIQAIDFAKHEKAFHAEAPRGDENHSETSWRLTGGTHQVWTRFERATVPALAGLAA